MSWSTRELADLADTTVNTIRHYHRLELLDEPKRRHNGYKQYGMPELVRLLRIRQLAELGMPLARIAELEGDSAGTADPLRDLDATLAATIRRLQGARAGVAALLRDGAPADTAAGCESVAARLSESDRACLDVSIRTAVPAKQPADAQGIGPS